ncbi:MAG: surface lipoprotein assembly modifier [Campylobacterota bacterium]|nr:surface lipoprotein assembly modifier [Campylobacterota bacterium]
MIYSSLFSDNLNTAIDLFKQNKFQKSIEILEKLSQNDLSNKKVNFYLARSYYEIKDYEQALIYFERIIISNENDLRARVELAQTYLMLGLDYDALENFNYVLNNDIPLNVKKNIENKIKHIENKKQKSSFKTTFGFGYTYDNNINNITDVKNFDTPNFQNLTITEKQIEDTNILLLLNANHKYKINNNNILENKLTIIQQSYDKTKEKNLELLSYDLSLSRYIKLNKFTYGLNITDIDIDDNNYLNMIGFNFNYEQKILDNIYSFLSFKYFDKKYQELENKKLDSDNYSIAIGNKLPTDKYGKFNFIYIYTQENLKKDDPNTTDKLTNTLIFSNNYSLTDKLSIIDNININYINELSNDATFEKKKIDTLYNISIGLSYDIDKALNITSTIKHIDNNSNIDIYSYDKQTIDIFIKKSF